MQTLINNLDKATKQELYDAYCAARNAADELENRGEESGAAIMELARQELRDEMYRRAR